MGIHFLISQIIGSICIWVLTRKLGQSSDAYFEYVILMTGITAILAMIPAWYFYKKDYVCRIAGGVIPAEQKEKLNPGEILLLLFTGAGLAQYGNVLTGLLQIFFPFNVYQESMEMITAGKSFLMLIFWMGIVAPVAEEFIFRWLVYLRLRDYMRVAGAAVISALIFGIYHGNMVQAVYASLLGAVFAYILEMSGNLWSCVLLHVGANVWSLTLSEFGIVILDKEYGAHLLYMMSLTLLVILLAGIYYFARKGKKQGKRLL